MELYPHQLEALALTKGMENIALYHDMGLGKTYTGTEMMKRFGCKANLIVCQKSKLMDWYTHIWENYGDKIGHIYDLTHGNNIKIFFDDYEKGENVIGIINYELAWRRPELSALKDFCLMLDESSLIQNTSAKQTKFILSLHPSHTILLSGTPVGGKYENLWSQAHLLGWKISEELFDKQYVNYTKVEVAGTVHKVVDKLNPYKNIDRLKSKFRKYGALFLKTEEVIDLPEQVFSKIKIYPPPEYYDFHKYGYTEIHGVEIVGDSSLTKMLGERKLCGFYNDEKLDAIRDLINSSTDRFIIFYSFNDELEQLETLCAELKRPVSEINGHKKDYKAYEEYDNSVTLCQYQAAAKGQNLQKCNRVIYYSLPLSSEDFEQSKKRTHRIGQDKTCFYYIPICHNTIEEKILATLEERKDYTDELFKEDSKQS